MTEKKPPALTNARVLVVGSGVIGCIYGSVMARSGHQVTILGHNAHDERLADFGITLIDVGSDETFTYMPNLVYEVDDGEYDLVILAVCAYDIRAAAAPLTGLRGEPHIVVLGHVPAGHASLPDELLPRTQLCFPGVTGHFKDEGTIEYVRLAMQCTLVEPTLSSGSRTFIRGIVKQAFPVAEKQNIDGWMAYHCMRTACAGAALWRYEVKTQALLKARQTLVALTRALQEGYAALQQLGYRGLSTSERALFAPGPSLPGVMYWQREMRSSAELAYEMYAASHVKEIRFLGEWARLKAAQSSLALNSLTALLQTD